MGSGASAVQARRQPRLTGDRCVVDFCRELWLAAFELKKPATQASFLAFTDHPYLAFADHSYSILAAPQAFHDIDDLPRARRRSSNRSLGAAPSSNKLPPRPPVSQELRARSGAKFRPAPYCGHLTALAAYRRLQSTPCLSQTFFFDLSPCRWCPTTPPRRPSGRRQPVPAISAAAPASMQRNKAASLPPLINLQNEGSPRSSR